MGNKFILDVFLMKCKLFWGGGESLIDLERVFSCVSDLMKKKLKIECLRVVTHFSA